MHLPFKTIRTSVIVYFSALILVALAIFYMISLRYTEKTVMGNSIDYTSRLVTQVNRDIDSYIQYMENISLMMVENEDVQSYFLGGESGQGLFAYERILTRFNTILESRADISNIGIVTGKAHIINDGGDSLNPNVDIDRVDWYKEALAGEDYILTASHVQYVIRNNYKWVVTLGRPFIHPLTGEREGVFFIDLNYHILKDLCENNSLGTDSYVFIMDARGKIIYHPKQQLLLRGLTGEKTEEVLAESGSYFVTREGDRSRLYTISRSESTGWSVVGVVEISELMKGREQTRALYLLVALLLLLSGILLAFLLARAITRPLQVLRDSMGEVEKGNFEKASIAHIPGNELGVLSNAFNGMTERIRQLMEQNVYEQEQKRKSEMKALRSQINPHFLYNTLDSIIWMAESGKNKEVILMTSSLARLLRQSISNEDEIIPLRKEVEYTRGYLTIQKMRYRDKLEFHVSVEEEILGEGIINLILQPLVENAIYHGIKNMEGKGLVSIRGYGREDCLILEVEDNGKGMDEETLAHIFDRSKERETQKRNGVGVYNVHMRLQLYYGEDYGLSFRSAPGEGTVVTVRIPRQEGGSHE